MPDHLGSASLIQDNTGRWLADHRFCPYGETRRSNGASESYPTDKLFTGMMLNSYIKLTRMGARWYDNELGRWISPDLIIPDTANPQSFNRYSYVEANPLRYVDPTGHAKYGGDDYDDADEPVIPPLPSSFVVIWVTLVGSPGYSSVGVAVATSAVLSHNHHAPFGEIESIEILDAPELSLHTAGSGDFAAAGDALLDAGTTLFVFEEDFMESWDTALLGDADALAPGDSALQSVRRGALPGLYETTVTDTNAHRKNVRLNPYSALVVSPDRTVSGDSGAPLYLDGRVYAVNNSGQGAYGPVRDVRRIQVLTATLTYLLNSTPNTP